jgi:hypothetical protein
LGYRALPRQILKKQVRGGPRNNKNTFTNFKMVSLYDFMFDLSKHNGHFVVMDSAYMSDAMCQVGRKEWKINVVKINMVGTCQTDRCGAGALG